MPVIHFLLALSLSLGPTMQAQSQQLTHKPKQTAPTSLQSPFDPAVSKLPPNFQGHDPEELAQAIEGRKRTIGKVEFESSEPYSKRIEALKIAPLFGKVQPDSRLAFVLRVDSNYDADTATFLLTRRPSHIGFIKNHNSKSEVAATLKTITVSHENEMRQNAYGARMNVEVTNISEFLGLMHPKEGVFGKAGAEIKIPVPLEQAPSVKSNLVLLLVCRLASLETLKGFFEPGGPATISRPQETFILQTHLQIEPLEAWAINKQTGEVYGKLKPKEETP